MHEIIDVIKTEPLAATETTGNKNEFLPVLPPVAALSMDDARYFAQPIAKKPEAIVVEDASAVMPAGAVAVMMTPNNEQAYFPKVENVEISMDDTRYFAQPVRKSTRVPVMMGEYFVDYGDGVIKGITPSGKEVTALKHTIDFLSEVRTYEDNGNYETAFIIRVKVKNGEEKDILVKSDEYANVGNIIKKKVPGAFKNVQAENPSAEYYAEKYNARGDLPIEVRTAHSGWFSIDGVAHYYIGTSPAYTSVIDPYSLDIVPELAIPEGLGFLAVGKNGPEVAMTFLFAHVAYLLYWLEREGIRFQSVLYIVGSTGSLKTAVTRVLSNIFDQGGKLSNGIRMTSTEASAKEIFSLLRDCFVLIDDFSNNNRGNNAKAVKLRYDVTRLLADDTVETKMDFSKASKIADTDFRTVVAFTGEDLMDLGKSTELRTVTVEFREDTVDARLLTGYQQRNGPMLRYFSLFIQFLTKRGKTLEPDFYGRFLQYRTDYGDRFPGMLRLADTAAQLRLTVDVIREFAAWGGCGDIQPVAEIFFNAIDTTLAGQAELVKSVAPHERFVRALFAGLAFGERSAVSGVADSEDEYNAYPKAFIGYRGTRDGEEVVYIRFDPAWDLAMRYFKKKEEAFFQKEQAVKDELVTNKLIFGIPKINGEKPVYSFKKSKNPRHNMTVFRMDAVNIILNQEV
ncbi:MAG: hypothetical protein IJ858_07395 [Acidaminococcaceae bacterium]|nr:hypothetical protein [Acidaminococcaceae bacterium]